WLKARIERQGPVRQLVASGELLVDPAMAVRNAPGKDGVERAARRNRAQEGVHALGDDGVALDDIARQVLVEDVELGNEDLETPRAQLAHEGCETFGVDLEFGMQMALQAHGMKWRPLIEQALDEIAQGGTLGDEAVFGRLDVVFVDGERDE